MMSESDSPGGRKGSGVYLQSVNTMVPGVHCLWASGRGIGGGAGGVKRM